MNKVQDLLQHIYIEYAIKNELASQPLLAPPRIHFKSQESFSLSYQKGEIKVEGNSPLGALYGLTQGITASRTPYLSEYAGEWQPHFPFRPLWLSRNIPIERLQDFSSQILEYGFNAVILGNYEDEEMLPFTQMAEICQALRDWGLKVILCPSIRLSIHCPLNPLFRQAVNTALKPWQDLPCDGLLWKTLCDHPHFTQHPLADDATLVEIVKEEMQILEQSLASHQTLIYYLSCPDEERARQQTKWFSFLCDQAGSRTYLAFPAVAGKAYFDHLPMHPIWDALRSLPKLSSTPLLPILNVGAIQQGEGLWPALSLDLIDRIMQRCDRHNFAGIIGLTNRFPKRSGLLSCNLWVLGQTLWHVRSPWLLAEIWFAAYRSDWAYASTQASLQIIRDIVVELSRLRAWADPDHMKNACPPDLCRLKAECLLAHLQFLQASLQDKKTPSDSPSFLDYFTYFCRDARRIILYVMQRFNLSISAIMTGHDWQSGFWSEVVQSSSQGIRNSLHIQFPTQPICHEQDTIMESIYQENTF